ncbi:reverse transcriptase domain protein [Colletotrichum truncatum]|uniref:Reverse transcriptase domain protein n=1 Tax=Colletotrichum truncatum TaxID=5467 RepID=A0ACC3YBY5_COLTU
MLYATEFRRLAIRLYITDENNVKDEIAKLEIPPSFLAYVEYTIKIDNRLYE